MRLTTFILIITIMQVSASTFAQRITLSEKNATLRKVFDRISDQCGYDFAFNSDLLKGTKPVTINVKNMELDKVLVQIFKDQPVSFSIEDKTVVVLAKEKRFFENLFAGFRAIDVRGKVLGEKGEPLVGATVTVKGTARSVKTDQNGSFYLQGVDEKDVLVISYIGYQNREVDAASDMGSLTMVLAVGELEEVKINAGYYTVTERERTGSISRVDTKTIAQQPVNNVLGALIGRMTGVNIEQQSGVNGGGFKVEIRGVNSLREEARQPLYLIDGIPYPATPMTNSALSVSGLSLESSPLNYISPLDIESIEILKDADATAIYGSRGANGVVLIRTKKAKVGRTAIDINLFTGRSKVGTKTELLNQEQYLEMRNEAFKNDNLLPGVTDYDVNGTWAQNRYTDWQKELIGGTAHATNMQTTISGGSEQTQILFRGNYSKNTTVTPDNFANQKASGTLTVNHTTTDKKFKLSLSATYALDNNHLPLRDLTQYINLPPNAPALFDAIGKLNWAVDPSGKATWNNPMAYLLMPYIGKTNSLISNGLFKYELLPGLSLLTNLGYTNIRLKENLITPIKAQAPGATVTGSNRISYNTIDTWLIEPQLNYKRDMRFGTLDLLIGSAFQQNMQNLEDISGGNYTSDLLINSIASAPTKSGSASETQYRYNAFFGRINYNYKGTYIINLTGRRDGSSRFGPNKRFANFAAVGVAWVFSDYQLIKENLPFLSFGKLRGSYGITGSDQIPDYGYLETYSPTNPYQNESGLFPTRIANPDYSWEINKKFETALEIGMLNEKLSFSVSYYRNRSANQLVGYTLPDIAGFPSVQYNLPATVQNTGWEFELNTTNISNGSLIWKSFVSLTIPKNKLLSYPNIAGSTYANTYTVGESLFTPRVYHFLQVDSETGLYKFQDKNANNAVDIADRTAAKQSLTSHLYGGIQNSFSYKNFTLDVFLQVVNKTARYAFSSYGSPGALINQPVEVLERWRKKGDQKEFQKFSQAATTGGAQQQFSNMIGSDRFSDASYIRLKNVSFSYSFPKAWIQKAKINNLRFYIQCQNLFTLTRFPGDPEVVNILSLPTLRSITTGLQLSI